MAATLSDKARAFLSERRFAVLGTVNPDGTPQLTVMWYDLEGDTILMNTAAGRVKDSNLRRDPRVSLCIEEGYSYVSLSGTVELDEADQAAAQAVIYRLAVRYEGEARAEEMAQNFRKQRRVTLRMRVEHVSEHL